MQGRGLSIHFSNFFQTHWPRDHRFSRQLDRMRNLYVNIPGLEEAPWPREFPLAAQAVASRATAGRLHVSLTWKPQMEEPL